METIDKLSLSTSVFGKETEEHDLLEMLDITAEAGFEYVEISRKQRNICSRLEEIKKRGLKIWSIHGIMNGGASLDETERKKAVAEAAARAEDTACFAPCPLVEHYENRRNDPAYGEAFKRSIAELYEHTHRLGMILAVETAPYKPKYDERYPDSYEIAQFVRSFKADDLLMTIDINHSNLNENLIDVCKNCSGLIANVHVSDNRGKWEDHLVPGKGIINLPETFAALRSNGYCGPCNLEFHDEGFFPTAKWLREIRINLEKLLWKR